MADILTIFLFVGGILIFGFFAEYIFKRFHVPDILLLVLLGFLLGPHVFNFIPIEKLTEFAPLFTTFALLFILFDGAFGINLTSFAKGIVGGLKLTFFNFFISFIAIGAVASFFGFDLLTSALIAVILGGVSSSFVVPVLKKIRAGEEPSSALIFESALTDVLSIVLAITLMEIIVLSLFDIKIVLTKISSLFAIAGLIGIVGGILWIVIVTKLIKEEKPYMITIAYLLFVYVITEFLGGNGAISALFLGLVLKNSKPLEEMFFSFSRKKLVSKSKSDVIVPVTSRREEAFHHQISFFIKTFFFVYIGMLFDITDKRVLVIAGIIAVVLMFTRSFAGLVSREYKSYNQKIIKSLFARGLASAVVAQLTITYLIPEAEIIVKIVYGVIVFTILLSSIRIFIAIEDKEFKREIAKLPVAPLPPS